MIDGNTKIKDLTEMQRMIIGSSVNLAYNLMNNQIYHIENHDENLLNLLNINEEAQKEFIIIKNFLKLSFEVTELFGHTFDNMSEEEKEILSEPASKLESFFFEVFSVLSCKNHHCE